MRLTRKTDTPKASGLGISRRQFLKRSGAATGGVAAVGFMGAPMMRRAESADKTPVLDSPVETKRTICSHCSVGCGERRLVAPARSLHAAPQVPDEARGR